MKLTTASVAVAAMVVFAQSAQARGHDRHHRHQVAHFARHYSFHGRDQYAAQDWFAGQAPSYFGQGYSDRTYSRRDYSRPSGHSGRRTGGRPAAWCGWEMRQLVSSDPGPAFNLARNWAHWGQPGQAGIGAVVVWSHHVGKIVGEEGGEWVIESGNDGNRVRTRPRSIAGAIAIRWG
ncbi:MAG TPA: hypothetical protein VNZ48_04720 [Xanthobacteraceae bacterium]|jgi:hypothetical protein|nr:hypothetical protein [Xanthobacteraceae bacterium]